MKTSQAERWIEHRLEAGERPKTRYEYYVTGHSMFPIDMLRHDSAWPATGEDAAKIEWGFGDRGGTHTRTVKLYSLRPPTIDRWRSFNWPVSAENLEKHGFIDQLIP